MTAGAYYNEIDPFAAEWLRRLIGAGHIAAGDVDERSIVAVRPDDLRGYRQCHFFAGIGVWSYALRRAGWPDDRPVWTGSCPCQPFSAAGKQEGTADSRHLWPEWSRLIREHRPVAIFGEQVGAAIRHGWIDLVSADLEGLDYAIGAAVVGAHSVGAPHIRQRLFFVADSEHAERGSERQEHGDAHGRHGLGRSGAAGELADADGRNPGAEGLQRSGEHGQQPQDRGASGLEHSPSDGRQQRRAEPGGRGAASGCGEGGMEQSGSQRRERGQATGGRNEHDRPASERSQSEHGAGESGSHRGVALGDTEQPGSQGRERSCVVELHGAAQQDGPVGAAGFWSDCDWLPCIDGKARPVEPGTFPLAHGAPARVGRLRAYGNAICAEAACEFIRAYREVTT